MNLFGSRKPKTDPKETMEKLNETIETLGKKIDLLQTQADNELAIAKANVTTNKKKAELALRRKKEILNQVDKYAGMQLGLQQHKMSLDNAQAMKEVVSVMATTSKVLSELNKPNDVENVEKILDNIVEQTDRIEHVSEILSRPMTSGSSYADEDELLSELELLEQQDIDQKMLNAVTPAAVPSVAASPLVLPAAVPLQINTPPLPMSIPIAVPVPPKAKDPAPKAPVATITDEDDEIAQLKAAMLSN